MRIPIDTHTHTVASGHAYCTVDEMARGAKKRRLRGLVISDHGPAMPGATHPYFFGNMRILPEYIQGVRIYKGIESNILGLDGHIDLEPYILAQLDFVMAGFHEICFASQSREDNTRAMIAAIKNPYVDAISHPGNGSFPIDAESVVLAAAEYGKALEINDSSFRIRRGSAENCEYIARLCVEHKAPLVCGSDAHYWRDVGRLDTALALLKKVKAPEDLLINSSTEAFERYIENRRAERRSIFKKSAR